MRKIIKVTTIPIFFVFCAVQLNRAMSPTEHWENAHIVAAVSDDEIGQVTLDDLITKGL